MTGKARVANAATALGSENGFAALVVILSLATAPFVFGAREDVAWAALAVEIALSVLAACYWASIPRPSKK